jgi:hypothetical protein
MVGKYKRSYYKILKETIRATVRKRYNKGVVIKIRWEWAKIQDQFHEKDQY